MTVDDEIRRKNRISRLRADAAYLENEARQRGGVGYWHQMALQWRREARALRAEADRLEAEQ